jgi:murein DD-endopeptidase MepM/ murein hydrolase activator NlpD
MDLSSGASIAGASIFSAAGWQIAVFSYFGVQPFCTAGTPVLASAARQPFPVSTRPRARKGSLMHRRHRRTMLAALVAAGLISSGLFAGAAPAAAATGQVAGTGTVRTGGTPLNMRKTPSSSGERVGTVANGGKVWIMCQVAADQVSGTVRTTRMWNRLANNTYVSDAYVIRTGFVVPSCSGSAPSTPSTPAAGVWTRPVAAGLVSGFRTTSRPAHDGVDLGAARNTPIRAAAGGRVIRVVCNVSAGSCDVDGNRTLRGCGWYAEILHAGNVVTRYCHMVRRPAVQVGQTVARGQVIGYVGTSGSSSGPHLHFEVHINAPPATSGNAVNPIWFLRARGIAIG